MSNSAFPTTGVLIGTSGVIQTVQNLDSTNYSTTSQTMVASGVTVTITPTKSTNNIRITCGVLMGNSESSGFGAEATMFRGATDLTPGSSVALARATTGPNNYDVQTSYIDIIDSPNTTSPVTYTLYFRALTGATNTAYIGRSGAGTGNVPTSLTAQEILP